MSPATGGDLQQPTSVVHTELFSQPASTTHVLSQPLFFWFVFIDLPGGQRCETLPGIHFRCSHLFLPARPCFLNYRSAITPLQTLLCWSKHTNCGEKIRHKRLSKWPNLVGSVVTAQGNIEKLGVSTKLAKTRADVGLEVIPPGEKANMKNIEFA